MVIGSIPEEMLEEVEARRLELIERLSEVDDEIADLFLNEAVVSPEVLSAAIRRTTLALKFQPVFMGSAFKNKGAQQRVVVVGTVGSAPESDCRGCSATLQRMLRSADFGLETMENGRKLSCSRFFAAETTRKNEPMSFFTKVDFGPIHRQAKILVRRNGRPGAGAGEVVQRCLSGAFIRLRMTNVITAILHEQGG